MKRVWFFLTDLWCYFTHPDPMWPVNGFYRCPSCHRQYPVPWEKNGTTRWDYQPQQKQPVVLSRPANAWEKPAAHTIAEPALRS
jgi:hypothetical protein